MLQASQVKLGLDTGKKFPVGIYTNCKVSSVEVGDRYIDFNYESTENTHSYNPETEEYSPVSETLTHNKRVWFPDRERVYIKKDPTTKVPIETKEEAFQRDQTNKLAHIVKHLRLFLSPEEIAMFNYPDFQTFSKQTQLQLTPRLDNCRVNLKLVYDSDGQYSTFGNYPNYIEEYEEGSKPTIFYSKYEKDNLLTKKAQPKLDPKAANSTSSGLV